MRAKSHSSEGALADDDSFDQVLSADVVHGATQHLLDLAAQGGRNPHDGGIECHFVSLSDRMTVYEPVLSTVKLKI